jgi:hypothetical protein
MIGEQLNIIRLFEDVNDVELTIRQISKNLKKSYAFTNKHTHELIQQDILKKKVIGNAIVCSLNFSNEKILGLLIMNSINKKSVFEKNLKPESKKELSEYIQKLETYGSSIYTVFLDDSVVKIISETSASFSNSDKKVSGLKIMTLTKEQFSKDVPRLELSKIVLLKNYENFWLKVIRR